MIKLFSRTLVCQNQVSLCGMADGNLEAIKQASLAHAKEVSKKISGKKRHITSLEKKGSYSPTKKIVMIWNHLQGRKKACQLMPTQLMTC